MKVQNKDNKGNPYHSDSNGQFTSADGGGVKSEEKENQEFLDKPLDNRKNLSYTEHEKSGIGGFSFITKKGQGEPKEDKLRALLDEPAQQTRNDSFATVDLGGIDSILASKIQNTFDKLFKDYPLHLDRFGISFMSLSSFYDDRVNRAIGRSQYGVLNAWGGALTRLVFGIRLNTKTFASNDSAVNDHFETYIIDGSKLQTLLGSDDFILATISHEYGHIISALYSIMKSPYKEGIIRLLSSADENGIINRRFADTRMDPISTYFVGTTTAHTMEHEIFEELRKEYGLTITQMKERMKLEYGEYSTAKNGRAELISEAFANMRHLKDEDKTDFMRSFERIFNRKYKEVFGG